jgi:hypothetical protein
LPLLAASVTSDNKVAIVIGEGTMALSITTPGITIKKHDTTSVLMLTIAVFD